MNTDHLVSLKDAYDSGADKWGAKKKMVFGNEDKTMSLRAVG